MENLADRIKQLSEKQKALLLNQINLVDEGFLNTASGVPQQLIAYVIAHGSIDVKSLQNMLHGKLPKYMVPSKFIQIDKFPKLPNGKIDYVSLNNNIGSIESTKLEGLEVAINETEKVLIKIWEEILNVKPITVNDNFFEIGGDSILSIQIMAKARKAGLFFEPDHIFKIRTFLILPKL